ncbi:hypothetical protein SOVF_050010 [Spinacia oleracea]|uniref:G domain-containing protein n=1 Tax=Spinacia oleracea TaxID=3562 RepID=A0A9R0KAD8_SPIOL|nr:uncharacterized protein LOC110803211 [Spinacia oleracea]KNA20712.1 hypothetical protein SOVF_050010 [Spinacia oleracea]
MGGDHLPCSTSEDELSSLESDYPDYPSYPSSFYRDGDESISESYEFVPKELDELSHGISSNSVEFDGNLRRRKNAYNEIMRSYDELWVPKEGLYQAKSEILSYNPGSWISNPGGKKLSNYVIPKTTTLLLIGPTGSGKSSLVNKISRVFEDDKFASERAQVTYNPSTGEGTYFLQEYMVPRSSASFCLYDTRSLSENFADNDEMLQRWMTKGVRHGELVIRDSDTPSLKMSLKCKAQQSGTPSTVIRKVNFVIFIVNGFQVLRSMNRDKKEDRAYMEMVVKAFSCPYLSFKDDKPVIVVTHGDLLSLGDRARVRVYLGEKLGVPPAKQIFDIPDNSDPTSELTIVDMIRYSLEHADKNIPCKESRDWLGGSTFFVGGVKDKVSGTSILTLIFTAILLGMACVIMPINQGYKHNDPIVTSAIKLPSNEAHHSYIPREPLTTYQSNSVSTSAANHSHKNRGYENVEPQTTLIPTLSTESVAVTSEPEQVFPSSNSAVISSEPTLPTITVATNSEQALPLKSSVITSEPTFPSRSVEDYRHKRRESRSRSPSPEQRHPKAAVKWHKIRHLWLDSD